MRYFLALLAACHAGPSTPPATVSPAAFDVAFERILPAGARGYTALWTPGDKEVVIGTSRWSRTGQRRERNSHVRSGQLSAVGIASDGRVIGSAWEQFDPDHELAASSSWLTLDGKPIAALQLGWQAISDRVLPDIQVSPSGMYLFAPEHDALALREVATGQVLERFASKNARGCWIDDSHIAVVGHELSTFDLTTHRTSVETEHVPEGALIACDAAGGAAAVATDTDLAIIDLHTGAILGRIAQPDASLVAIGDHGGVVAVATDTRITIYRHELGWFATTYTHATPAIRRMAFSRDGKSLAAVGNTLVMFERGVQPQPPLALSTRIELPPHFVIDHGPIPTDYAQLPSPSGLTASPLELVRAIYRDEFAYVSTLAISPQTISVTPPKPDAGDAELETYANIAMHDLFEQWDATERDPDAFKIKVGHRDGKPVFETFEIWRDGCEPYDGYTQVVIDHDLLFVTRALVPPHGSTRPWLQVFFDQPFHAHTEVAHRRRGPDSGPC